MGSLAFDQLKQRLFLAYEDQIAALAESKDNSGYYDTNTAPSTETGPVAADDSGEAVATAAALPEHLRLSYVKQRLLCQRARRVTDRGTPPQRKNPWRATATGTPTMPGTVSTDAEQAEHHHELVVETEPDWLRRRMLQVQEESIQRLRSEALTTLRRQSTEHNDLEAKDGDSPTASPSAPAPVEDVLAIVDKGGISGDAFALQRLTILRQLERETQIKRIELVASQGRVQQ